MTAQSLRAGDKVYWKDPDGGLCSRFYTIKTLEDCGDFVRIEDVDGSGLECPVRELSSFCRQKLDKLEVTL